MESLLFIATIVAVIVIVKILWNKAFDKLNQNVFQRQDHHDGQHIIETPLEYAAVGSVASIAQSIRASVQAQASAPAIKPGYYAVSDVTDADGNIKLEFAYGNKLDEVFRVAVLLNEGHGAILLIDANLVAGVLARLDELKILRLRVVEGIRAIDPNAQFNDKV